MDIKKLKKNYLKMKNKKIVKILNLPFGCGEGYTQENKFTHLFWNIDYLDEQEFIQNTFVSCEFLYNFYKKHRMCDLTISEFELKLKSGNINFKEL